MSATTAGPSAPLTHARVLIVFSGLLLAMLLAALDQTIVATALPTIVGELGGLERLSWVVTSYLLAQTVVTPLYGKLGDLYGRKGILQGAVVLFLIGSALCGLSRTMMQLIAFRVVQGLGGGGLMVTAMAVVGDIIPPLGILALVVIAATLPGRSERQQRRIDWTGAALLATTLSAIILVTDLGGTAYPWSSPLVLGLMALCLVALAGFLFAERRAAEPVLPLGLFRNRAFS